MQFLAENSALSDELHSFQESSEARVREANERHELLHARWLALKEAYIKQGTLLRSQKRQLQHVSSLNSRNVPSSNALTHTSPFNSNRPASRASQAQKDISLEDVEHALAEVDAED